MNLAELFAVDPGDLAERWRRVAQFVEEWWGPLTADDGAPEDELRVADARLGHPLPAALREAYARFGQRPEIAASFDRLVPARLLRQKDGRVVVWVCGDSIEWAIREADLGEPDPPMFVRERHNDVWEEHAALPHEPSVSRFFVWKTLEQATDGSRYDNSAPVDGDIEPLAVEVARRFQLVDCGHVERPRPSTRLYVGQDVIVAVRANEGIRIAAPNRAAYRRAIVALEDLSLPWQFDEEAAYQGEFAERRQGHRDMELLLRVFAKAGGAGPQHDVAKLAEQGSDGRGATAPPGSRVGATASAELPRSDDRATGLASDLDPRVSLHVEEALRPLSVLLPPTCIAHIRGAFELAVETHPTLESYANMLVGKPLVDDVVGELVDPEIQAKMEAMGLTPDERDQVEAVLATGMIENLAGAVQRRFARMSASGDDGSTESEEEWFDYEITSVAESAMDTFLLHTHTIAVLDRDACEAELSRVLNLLAASMFTGIVAALFRVKKGGHLVRYARAVLTAGRMPSSGQDDRLFTTYYMRGEQIHDVAKRLSVPVAVEYGRHLAYLERVAAVISAAAAVFTEAGYGRYQEGEVINDAILMLMPQRRGDGVAG